MSDIALRVARKDDTTYLSNVFIDHYLKEANGEYLKIYIYLLRCLGDKTKDFSISAVADALDHTQRDVSRALLYWERKGLLRLEYSIEGELSGICLMEPKAPVLNTTPKAPPVIAEEHVIPEIPKKTPIPEFQESLAKGPDYSYSLMEQQLLSRNPEVIEILFCTEQYTGHTLSPKDIDRVLYWYDGLHFSADLVEYLVEDCVEQGHKNINYMNKVALSWAEEGIFSVEQAREYNFSFRNISKTVCSAFGISGRNLTSVERQFLDRWSNDWNMDNSLVEEACKRTILKTGRASFQYADSILQNWHKASAKTLEDITVLDKEHSKSVKTQHISSVNKTTKPVDRFHNFNGHNYDFDSLENRLLQQQ